MQPQSKAQAKAVTAQAPTAPVAAAQPQAAAPVVAHPSPLQPTLTSPHWYSPLPPGVYPEDSRYNIADLTIAPGVFYAGAASNYWYRRYFSSGPSIDAKADFWFNPNLGLNFNYFTSLGGDIEDSPSGSQPTEATTQIFNAALSYRAYMSDSRKSPSLTFSLGYNDYQLNVAKTDPNRIGIEMSGIDLGILMKYPVTATRAWILSSDILPRLNISEHTTGVSVSSGSSPSAYAVKFGFGQEFMLDRSYEVFWKLTERYDKSIYTGTASAMDPVTGTTPSGVDVSTSTTIFSVGFTWGG